MLRNNFFKFCFSSASGSSSSSKIRSTRQARRKWEENLSDFLSERTQSRSEVLQSRYKDIYVHKDFTPVQEVFPEKSQYESKKWSGSSSSSSSNNENERRQKTSFGKRMEPISSSTGDSSSSTGGNKKKKSPEAQKRRDDFMKRVDKVNQNFNQHDSSNSSSIL